MKMTIIDKLNGLGQDLGISYEDNFGKELTQHSPTGAIDSFWPVRKELSSDKLKYLYHYTSLSAAFNIMEKRTLRATDAYFLNDLSEIKHGADALSKALKKLRTADWSKYKLIEPAVNFLARPFSKGYEEAYALHRGNAYVVSLSTKGDDVSQWQKYAVRYGVSLGFRVDLLSRAMLIDCNNQKSSGNETTLTEALLAPVIYDSVNDLAELVFEDMFSLKLNDTSSSQEIHSKLVERYACFGSLMKHPSFSSENEWRLLLTQTQVDRGEVCWQTGEAYARPYANLGFAEKGKDWQKCNPTEAGSLRAHCNVKINAQDYDLARHYFDFIGVNVSKSATPLRPQQS